MGTQPRTRGVSQIGSASLVAMGVSAAFGTGAGVLGGAVNWSSVPDGQAPSCLDRTSNWHRRENYLVSKRNHYTLRGPPGYLFRTSQFRQMTRSSIRGRHHEILLLGRFL